MCLIHLSNTRLKGKMWHLTQHSKLILVVASTMQVQVDACIELYGVLGSNFSTPNKTSKQLFVRGEK